jgi:hypothetical protein
MENKKLLSISNGPLKAKKSVSRISQLRLSTIIVILIRFLCTPSLATPFTFCFKMYANSDWTLVQ